MSYTGLPQFQAGLVTKWRATAALMAMLKGGLRDDVPQTKVFPYAVIDDPFETPDPTLGQGGHLSQLTLVIYTQDGSVGKAGVGSAGWLVGLQIAELAAAAVTNIADPIAVAGHDVVDVDVVSIDGSREPDGVTRRTELTLQAMLEDAP
jgi:hypothetical protein